MATAVELPESTVRRRLGQLFSSGAIQLDLDLDPAKLGYGVGTNLYIKVETRHLHAAGTAITTHGPTMSVAVVSGPANLQATVVGPTVDALYDYLTSTLAQVPGITDIETSLTGAFVKHARTAWR